MAGNYAVSAYFWLREQGYNQPNEHGYAKWKQGCVVDRLIVNGVRIKGTLRFDLLGNIKANTLVWPDGIGSDLIVDMLSHEAGRASIANGRYAMCMVEWEKDRNADFQAIKQMFDDRSGPFADVPLYEGAPLGDDYHIGYDNEKQAGIRS